MHIIGASLDFSPVGMLLISLSLARNEIWRPIRWRLYGTAFLTWVAMVLFMVFLPYDGHSEPGGLAGLFGRFLLISYIGWLMVVALFILNISGKEK